MLNIRCDNMRNQTPLQPAMGAARETKKKHVRAD